MEGWMQWFFGNLVGQAQPAPVAPPVDMAATVSNYAGAAAPIVLALLAVVFGLVLVWKVTSWLSWGLVDGWAKLKRKLF